MTSGRIQPGSRQWVEAMRRLSGTTDATVDMSMGRKVSRDAAIPHGMGTAALDTRLRGGGGAVPEYDARDPASLPVGPDWLKLNAYVRPEGETRQGPALDFFEGAPGEGPWVFVFNDDQSAGQWTDPPGIETVLLSERTGPDIGVVIDGTGKVLARFIMNIPADLTDGERRPPPPTVEQQVERILAGTNGFVVDFTDRSTLFSDAAGVVPATADGSPIRMVQTKFGLGQNAYSADDDAARPLVQQGGAAFDGVDDRLRGGDGLASVLRKVSGAYLSVYLSQNEARQSHPLVLGSSVGIDGGRLRVIIETDGRMRGRGNRPDTAAATGGVVAGAVQSGIAVLLGALANFDVGGSLQAIVNDEMGGGASFPGGGPFTDDSDAVANWIGAQGSGGFFSGMISRIVVCPFRPTNEQMAVFLAWASDVSFDRMLDGQDGVPGEKGQSV